MALKPELEPVIQVLNCGLGVIFIFFALSQGHQQNILGMSGQTESVSIVSQRAGEGLAFL